MIALHRGNLCKAMKCSKCEKETEDRAFSTYRDRKGIKRRAGVCKACRGQYALDNFEKLQKWRKEYNIANRSKSAERSARVRAENKAYIDSVKANPCMDCGKSFPPVCMDFDHVNGDKIQSISSMCSSCYKLDLIKEEIAKCELVCSNCHRIRTRDRKDNLAAAIPGRTLTGGWKPNI